MVDLNVSWDRDHAARYRGQHHRRLDPRRHGAGETMTALENTATDPSKETVVLTVGDLGVGVRADDVDYALVHDVSFDVASGEVVCLVGESGSGKSLTASAILGLAQRNSHLNVTGDVVVKGRDLTRLSQRQL